MSETAFYNSKNIVGIGSVGIGTTNPSYKFVIDNGSTTGGIMDIRAPNITAGQDIWSLYGKATSQYNCAVIRWTHVGDGLTTNYLGLGAWNSDNKLNVTAGGNVGIGTTSPSAPLMVYNASSTDNNPVTSHLYVFNPTNSAGQNAIISVRNGGSAAANVYVSFDVANSHGFSIGTGGGDQRLSFRTSWDYRGTEAMSILYSNGYVGIGTTSPQATLDVRNSALIGDYGGGGFYNSNAALHVRRDGVNPHIIIENIGVSTGAIAGVSGGMVAGTDGSFITFRTACDTAGDFTSTGTERMRINATGVGIGTTDPGASLQVSGNIYASNALSTTNVNLATATLGTAAAGEIQYNTYLYSTINTTHGRGSVPVQNIYRRTTNSSAFGPSSNYFFSGTTTTSSSAINLAASSVYNIEMHAYFTKTTAGTVTWTLIASSAPTLISASFTACPVTGIGAGTPTSGFASSQAATTAAFSATGTLTTGVNHSYMFKVQVITNLATTFTLQVAQSAGTMTALAGSYYMVTPVSTTTGAFT